MKVLLVICIAFTFNATAVLAKDKCVGSDVKHYDQAIRFHLAKQNVSYTVITEGTCVLEKDAAAITLAENQVDKYFHEVAHILKDACEEKAFVDWASGAHLRFDVRPSMNSQNLPAGNMFFLRSFTAEEVNLNRDLLNNKAPKSVRCKPVN